MTARDPGDISFGLDGVTQGAAREAAAVFCHVRQLTGQFLRAAANARAHGQEADQAGRPRAQSHSPHAGGHQRGTRVAVLSGRVCPVARALLSGTAPMPAQHTVPTAEAMCAPPIAHRGSQHNLYSKASAHLRPCQL